MKKKVFVSLGCFCGMLFIFSCKKDSADPYSVTPEIEFTSISPSQVVQYQSPLTLTIAYKDGDGDLGENGPDVKNLFVIDSRNGVTYKYRVQQLAPDNSKIAIKGNLNVVLNSVALTDTTQMSQTFTYDVYIVDRAGHQSNTVTSSAIMVTK